MKPLFITATGTGIGKTIVTTILAWQAKQAGKSVRALKPVISGFTEDTYDESDTALILRSLNLEETEDAINNISPWRYEAPLAPDMAAARENAVLDFEKLISFCKEAVEGPDDIVLIEGVGGLMVPLSETRTVLDWIKALDCSSLLVSGSYLGTISHTLTAMETAEKYHLPIKAIIISESEESPVPVAETAAVIGRFLPGTPVLELPRLPDRLEQWRYAPGLLTKML